MSKVCQRMKPDKIHKPIFILQYSSTIPPIYILPIALCALVNPLPVTVALAILCTVLQDLFGPPADSINLRIAHIALGLTGFLIVGFLVTLIARQRERLVAIMGNALLDEADRSPNFKIMLKQTLSTAVADGKARQFLSQMGWL